MDNITEESGRVASLAVFRELYDSEKDIYGVISCFLTEVIITEAKRSFTLNEIAALLNKTFNFNIPEAVVKTSLGRLSDFLKKGQGIYSADLSKVKRPSLIPKKDEITKSNDLIIKQLIDFISIQKGEEMNESEIEGITHSFCSFLLDEQANQKYFEYISAFIISNQNNPDFIKRFQCIKEGVVLYTGIVFSENINNIGSWNTELTIFLDTEILFDFAGLNGELYKSLFGDLFSFVKEINQKAGKPLIKLRYFVETRENIEDYFRKAEYIIAGNSIVDPGRPAMNDIINGCKSRSDILEKKIAFFSSLSTNNILEDDYLDYFKEGNHKHNIVDRCNMELIAKSLNVDSIIGNLSLLNLVSIRRGESCNDNFEHIKYILLSGTHITLSVAIHDEIKSFGKVPLATSLSFLTNKFWFKLNKGFGANTFPKVFDIITKAQILLSGQLNKSVVSKFEELQNKYKNGLLTKEEVATIIAELKKGAKKPEDINKKDLPFILDSISENSIEKMVQEQEYSKRKAEQQEEENVKLKKKIEKEIEEKKIALAKEGEKEATINNIKARIKDKCHRRWTERVNCCLWVIWGLFMSMIVFFEFYIPLYGSIFLAFIITIVFTELRSQKNFLSKLPPKITEWIPPKWLNFFPKIRSNFEKKLIESCVTKARENTGLDSV